VKFATATAATDPQTHAEVPIPVVTRDGAGKLSGDLRAFAAQWNHQHFNQGDSVGQLEPRLGPVGLRSVGVRVPSLAPGSTMVLAKR
jgi:hypothetical protein